MAWEIQGERGKRFGDDLRLASRVSADVNLQYESLQPDRVSWSVTGKFSTLSDLAIPEVGEELQIYRDGVRKFRGIVTQAPVTVASDNVGVAVQAEGAHWWLEKTPLTDPVEDVDGTVQERAVLVFSKGRIEDNFRRLFARAQEVGLPVKMGTISECYEVPQLTVSDGSFADALAELVELVPDAITWWDYSGEIPAFNLARRGSAKALDLTYGEKPLVAATFQPVLGLETEEVVVQYAQRGQDGLTRYQEQRVGSAGVTKRQVIITSGEELADILPPDPIENITVTTGEAVTTGGGFLLATALDLWTFFTEWETRFPSFTSGVTAFSWLPTDSEATEYSEGVVPKYYREDGSVVTIGASMPRHAVITPSETPPDWLIQQIGLEALKLKGTVYLKLTTAVVSDYPDWLDYLLNGVDYIRSLVSGGSITFWLFYNLDLEVWGATDANAPITNGDFYEPLAYQFSSPPPGFAAALREAQGFLPYQGTATLTEQDAGGDQALGKVLNIAGALEEWRAMRALVQGVDLRLSDGTQIIRCGSPQRVGLLDIVNRLKVDRRDSVELL